MLIICHHIDTGPSPGQPSPQGFPGPQQDPYHHMPPTQHPQDPYAIAAPMPRQTEFNVPPNTSRAEAIQSPPGRKPVDPFCQSPSTPRPREHLLKLEQFRSPVNCLDHFGPNIPGLSAESFGQVTSRPQPGIGQRPPLSSAGMWSGPEPVPHAQPPGTPRLHGLQIPHRFETQVSAPQPSPTSEDPFSLPPTSEHPETTAAMDPFAQSPALQPRPTRPHMQRVQSMPGGEGHMLPGQQFRHPFRPSPGMMRPPGMPGGPPGMPGELYPQQSGIPRHRMEDNLPPHPGNSMPPQTGSMPSQPSSMPPQPGSMPPQPGSMPPQPGIRLPEASAVSIYLTIVLSLFYLTVAC